MDEDLSDKVVRVNFNIILIATISFVLSVIIFAM